MAYVKSTEKASKFRNAHRVVYIDAAPNLQSKAFLFGSNLNGASAELVCAHILYAATADAGNRQITLTVTDASANVTRRIQASSTAAAAGSTEFEFAPGLNAGTGTVVKHEQLPIGFVLLPGETLTVAAVSGENAGDDMTVTLHWDVVR